MTIDADFPVRDVARYTAEKLGMAGTVTKVRKMGRGSSRQTWFVTIDGDQPTEQRYAIRCDHPSGATDPSPLDREFFIYDRLGRSDVPVARALAWEDDPAWATRPFYVRAYVEGSWDVPNFINPAPEYDDLRIAVSRSHLAALAKVHRLDWRGLGFDAILPAPDGVADCGQNYVRAIIDQYLAIGCEAVPILVEAAAWLKAHAPVAPCVSLCKGTNGLGEEVLRDGRIVALSDWEEVSIGDPAADFAFMQNFVPEIERDGVKLWGLLPALDYYHEISGIRIDPASVRYYGTLRALKIVIFSLQAARTVAVDPVNGEVRAAWTAIEPGNLGKHLLAAAMGWLPPPDPGIFQELNQSVDQS